MSQQLEHGAQARLAVSTVIFALQPRRGRRRARASAFRSCAASASPARAAGRCPAAGCPSDEGLDDAAAAHAAPRPRASRRATSSSSTRSATSTAPPTSASSRSCTGRSCSPTRRERAVADENVQLVRRRRPARARLRPQPHRRLRALAAAHQAASTRRIAHAFLGETFTLAELREVHEAVLQPPPRPGELPPHDRGVRHASSTPASTSPGTPHRPPALYRFDTGAGPADIGPPSRAPHCRGRTHDHRTSDPHREHDARRGIRRPHHPAHRDGRDAGRDLLARARQGPVGVRLAAPPATARARRWAT